MFIRRSAPPYLCQAAVVQVKRNVLRIDLLAWRYCGISSLHF